MTFQLVIRNASVVSSQGIEQTDVGISFGRILAVGDLSNVSAVETVDATGLHLFPGGIDTQVHFREPGLTHKEDLESGSRAAVFGGITSFVEMPNTNPTTTSAETLADKLARAETSWANFGFFVGASTENAADLQFFENLPGTPGIKIFMGSSTGPLLVSTDDDLRRVLLSGRKRCAIHAEDEPRNTARKSLVSDNPHPREHPFLRDAESAELATNRIIALSRETGRPIHILHISTGTEPFTIQTARQLGVDVTCEVTPQHLYFSAPECYDRLGSHAQMNPPVRSSEHQQALWKALDEGIFDVFGSDHAPHTLEEKNVPYPKSPSGMPGVQTMLPVLLTFASQGRLDLKTIAKMLCERPASIYGMVGKGHIAPGFDADLTLVDVSDTYEFTRAMVQSKCGWSPYEGERLTGRVHSTIVGGQIVVRDGELVGHAAGRVIDFRP